MLRHRIVTNFTAEAEGVKPERIIDDLLKTRAGGVSRRRDRRPRPRSRYRGRPTLELKRQIGLYAATAITVGNIIGSGIFRSPHSVAQEITQRPARRSLAWVVGGVLSICGSLVLAELAVTHPRTGGLYVFIREAFGDALGFVFGWANLWVIKPTVIASITSVFALYFCQVLRPAASRAELPVGVGGDPGAHLRQLARRARRARARSRCSPRSR